MRIGIPKEIKNEENRVGLTPGAVLNFVKAGHEALVEKGAGLGAGFSDRDYEEAGARVVGTAAEVWAAELVVKVKEPLPEEYGYFREGLVLFTFLHLAANAALTKALADSGTVSFAYETIQLESGALPLLMPMSEVAGRMSVQIGAHLLEKAHGGKGVLLGGVPGVAPGKVTIVGGGIVGTNAARMALGLGADVSILDVSADRLRQLDELFGGRVRTLMSGPGQLADAVRSADLLIGAVLVPGARAPKLVSEEMVSRMEPGSVIVDVAIDQGGSIATIDRVTTHDSPTYVKHGVVHYSVANIPGAVPRTSTLALNNVTVPYGLLLAGKGWRQAATDHPALAKGINTAGGKVTYRAVAEAHGLPHADVRELLTPGNGPR